MAELPPDQIGELASALTADLLQHLAHVRPFTINVNVTVRLDLPTGLELALRRLAAIEHSASEASTDPPARPAADRASERTSPPDGGGGEVAAAELPAWRQQLTEYLVRHDLSIDTLARKLGFCSASVRGWINGTTQPRTAGLRAIETLLADDQEPDFEPNDQPSTIGNLPQVPSCKQAAAYLQRTLAAWQTNQKYDHDRAAQELGIPRQTLLRILQVQLPDADDLQLIVARIPELKPDLPALLQAQRMESLRATA